jgi:hypothetical protein
MLQRKAQVYRLYPTPEQATTLGQWVGAVRATDNLALEQRRVFWRPGRTFNFASQCREVTALPGRVRLDARRAGTRAATGHQGPGPGLSELVGRSGIGT